MIAKGNIELNKFYLGSTEVSAIYLGDILIWPTDETVDLSDVTDVFAYGDSYTNPGLQASGGGTPAANSYIAKLIDTIGKGITNRGATGTGILTAVNSSFVNDVQPRVRGIIIMTGLNDVNRNGGGASFLDFWAEEYKVFLVANLISSGQGASEISAAGWFNHEHGGFNKAHQFGVGQQLKATQTLYPASAELSYTFSDDHVVMQYLISLIDFSNPATYLDTMEVRIDGELVETIDCNVQNEQDYPGWEVFSDYIPRVKIYSGLSVGSHTITIRRTANSGGVGGGIWVDYFGHLGTNTTDTKAILIGAVTYITDYNQAAPYNNGSDAGVDDMNEMIASVVDEIKAIRPDLPIVIMETNTDAPLLDSGDYNADGLHWNDSGHDKGYQKFLNRISAY